MDGVRPASRDERAVSTMTRPVSPGEFHNNGTRPPPRAMVDDKKAALARLKASRQSRRAEGGAPEWNATPEPTAAARCASPSVRAGVPTAAHNLNSLLIQPTPLLQAQAEALGSDVAQG